MNSLGDLVDRISIVNIKLWFTQGEIHKAAKEGTGVSAEVASNLVSLNMERNRLMSEIDATFAEGVKTGQVRSQSRIKF